MIKYILVVVVCVGVIAWNVYDIIKTHKQKKNAINDNNEKEL